MVKIRNPLNENWEAPDPFMTYCAETGYYYALFTRGKDVAIFRSRHAGNILKDDDFRIIFTPGENGIYPPIWAPGIHKVPTENITFTQAAGLIPTIMKTAFRTGIA